tara:strand:+ start:741 stop:1052 length:312 start_codon:yes stop_codon:yes gene_type:complete
MSATTNSTEEITSRLQQFICDAPDAEKVLLASSFNDWKTDATPMSKGGDGEWTAEIELSPGRYEFKFVVDGEWCCEANCQSDGECPQCVANDFGTMNRVCEVA